MKTIDCDDFESALDSIASIFEVDRKFIGKFILDNQFRVKREGKCLSYDNASVYDLSHYLNKHHNIIRRTYYSFDKICLFHMTSPLDIYTIQQDGLVNLLDYITKHKEFIEYVSRYNINIIAQNGRIKFYYNGALINDENSLLRSRGKSDHCVNGFLFNSQIYNNTNVRHFQKYPEILSTLKDTTGIFNLTDRWRDNSKTYIIKFEINFGDLHKDSFTNEKYKRIIKKHDLINRILDYLILYHANEWRVYDNHTLYLKDNLNVNPDQIKDIRYVDSVKLN